MYYKRIRELREDNDIPQKDIAIILNTSQQHYSRIEKGSTEITADRVVTLAKFYNVTTDYLLGLSDKKK
ncbi:MAG: helix-turn-helix transcriptional regulator [Clostridia bacterium]|nr:helix-turn-helix transcriptional regulator [Clostridia bacterium]